MKPNELIGKESFAFSPKRLLTLQEWPVRIFPVLTFGFRRIPSTAYSAFVCIHKPSFSKDWQSFYVNREWHRSGCKFNVFENCIGYLVVGGKFFSQFLVQFQREFLHVRSTGSFWLSVESIQCRESNHISTLVCVKYLVVGSIISFKSWL